MTDAKGRYIWGEDNAISWNGTRKFRLGKDNAVYRIYVRTTNGRGTVEIQQKSNVVIRVL